MDSCIIFGGGRLQKSVIGKSINKGLFTIVVDPDPEAYCRDIASLFVHIHDDEFSTAAALIEQYNPRLIITAATDKPLINMAKLAARYNLPFFSVDTAISATDKYIMKQRFAKASIPYAKGYAISTPYDIKGLNYPIILKPRDNSGSRGVFLCNNAEEAEQLFGETLSQSRKNSIIAEEYIPGKEYSIESLHTHDKTRVIQITEKTTTRFPYNVELGHRQPGAVDNMHRTKIEALIGEIASAFKFEYCASHTELKITPSGDIFIIETSPRLGGDFITSKLTTLSTGIDMEEELLSMLIEKETYNLPAVIDEKWSEIVYLNLCPGSIVKQVSQDKVDDRLFNDYEINLKAGDRIPVIKSSLDRYGYYLISANTERELETKKIAADQSISKAIALI